MPQPTDFLVWWDSISARLDHLCRLPTGWDGYQGRAVDPDTAHFASRVLAAVCDARTPAPSIVPGASGDLQIEWHTTSWDLEIDITGPDHAEAWRRTAGSGREDEIALTNDFTDLRKWVSQIAEPMNAARAATA